MRRNRVLSKGLPMIVVGRGQWGAHLGMLLRTPSGRPLPRPPLRCRAAHAPRPARFPAAETWRRRALPSWGPCWSVTLAAS